MGWKHVCIQSKPSATGSGRSSWCVVPKPWLRSVWIRWCRLIVRWSRCGSRYCSKSAPVSSWLSLMPKRPAGRRPGVLLCLPYLRVPQWHVRWRLLGRSFGWRLAPVIENRTYFKRAICAALRPLPANAPLRVHAHPKNETHHGLIERLLASLRPGRSWELLPADEPLEVRLLRGWSDEGIRRRNVLGFGTNLLAAAVFLSPPTPWGWSLPAGGTGLVARLHRSLVQPP